MDNAQLYKKISVDIIFAINNDKVDDINKLLSERQNILDEEMNNKQFIEKLKKDGIVKIDQEIKQLLEKSISNVKLEIKKHKQLVQVNNSYTNSFKGNLNIFYKKV